MPGSIDNIVKKCLIKSLVLSYLSMVLDNTNILFLKNIIKMKYLSKHHQIEKKGFIIR